MKESRWSKVHKEERFGYPEVIFEEKEIGNSDINFGDKVRIYDFSYNFDSKTGRHLRCADNNACYTAIVIQAGCNRFVQGVLDWVVQCDLLILYQNGQTLYVNSNMVKVI